MEETLNEPHSTYLVRPSVRKLFYGLFLSLGTGFLGYAHNDFAFQVVASLAAIATIFLILQYFYPRKLLLGTNRIVIPRLIPGQVVSLNIRFISGWRVRKFKGTDTLFISHKNGKVYSIDIEDIQEWDKFFKDLSNKVPALTDPTGAKASKARLMFIGAFVWLLMGGAVANGLIDQRTGIMVSVVATCIVFLGMFARSEK